MPTHQLLPSMWPLLRPTTHHHSNQIQHSSGMIPSSSTYVHVWREGGSLIREVQGHFNVQLIGLPEPTLTKSCPTCTTKSDPTIHHWWQQRILRCCREERYISITPIQVFRDVLNLEGPHICKRNATCGTQSNGEVYGTRGEINNFHVHQVQIELLNGKENTLNINESIHPQHRLYQQMKQREQDNMKQQELHNQESTPTTQKFQLIPIARVIWINYNYTQFLRNLCRPTHFQQYSWTQITTTTKYPSTLYPQPRIKPTFIYLTLRGIHSWCETTTKTVYIHHIPISFQIPASVKWPLREGISCRDVVLTGKWLPVMEVIPIIGDSLSSGKSHVCGKLPLPGKCPSWNGVIREGLILVSTT